MRLTKSSSVDVNVLALEEADPLIFKEDHMLASDEAITTCKKDNEDFGLLVLVRRMW